MEIKDKFIELAGPIKPATVSKIATLSEYVMDAALGEFQGALNEKFAIKDDDGSVQKSPFRYVANEEYRLALVDEDGGFLFGVRQNGSVEWTEGIPAPIVAKLQEMADERKQDKADIAEDLANIEATKADKTELAKVDEAKVDKEEGKGLITTVISDKLSLVDEEGFLFAFKDAEGHFLGGIRDSGSWDIPSGIPDESRALLDSVQKQIDEIVYLRDATYHITEQEGYLLAITDNKGGFLGGIRKSGQWDIPNGIPAETKANLDAIYKALQEVNTTISAKVEERNTLIKEVNDSIDAEVDARTSLIKEGQSSYAWVVADKEGNVWLGGNLDGTVDMPKGVPAEVQTMLDNIFGRLSAIEDVVKTPETGGSYLVAMVDANGNELLSISKDGEVTVADGLKSLNGYSVKAVEAKNGTANNLYTIVDANDKVVLNITKEGKMEVANGLSLDNGSTGINVQDTEGGWLFAILDADGKVLGGFRKDGKFFANSIQIDGLPSEYDSDSYLYAITDNENHVLWGILKSGAVYQPSGMPMEVEKKLDSISSKIASMREDLDYTMEHGADWSDEKSLHLPMPIITAKVEINGNIPTSKYIQTTGTLKYTDYLGNSFTKEIMWNTQGNVSAGFDKKNFSVDLFNSIDEDDAFSVKFGDWVAQDGYHLKAYYSDFWKIRSLGVYRHMEQINQSRPYFKRYPYSSIMGTNKQTDDEVLKGGSGEIFGDIHTGALCHPDGFPILLYINGIPWGLYTWNLKKSKENYNIAKNDNDGLQMCFGDYMNQVFERYDSVHWQVVNHNLTDTTGVEKWDETKDYAIDDVCYDEETFDYEVNGKTSSFTLRRKFKAIAVSGPTTKTLDYVSTRPSQIGWKRLEVRNPKKTICHEISYDGNGNKVDSYEYYDYDSPADYSQTGVYERTHEIISGEELSQKEAVALGFSKKEYTRSVNARKKLDAYSKSLCVIRGNITVQNLLDWGFVEEFDATKEYAVNDVVSYNLTLYKFTAAHAAGEWTGTDVATTSGSSTVFAACRKQIFDEHHDTDYMVDYYIVMNDCNYYDSVTHNTIYTFYDGQHLMAHVYDTDISLGMGSTYVNSFPSVSTGLINTECFGYLWSYHSTEIKARWAELRNSGVISADNFEKMVWDLVNSVGSAAYEEELNTWRDQSSYRNPTYWRMPAGSLQVLTDDDGIYHGYDESLNKEVEGYETWDATKQYANGDWVNYNGHSYQANAVPPVGVKPSDAYSCGNPPYGVWDSPRRCIEWFRKRLTYLDKQFGYTASN